MGPVDFLFQALRRRRMRWRPGRGGTELGFDIGGALDLGETLSNAVLLLGFCDRCGLRPRLRFSSSLFRTPGRRDWFDAYFRLRGPPPDEVNNKSHSINYIKVRSQADYPLPGVGLDMTLTRASELFHQYLAFDPMLLAEAEAFADSHGLDASSIAVHFRSADRAKGPPQADRKAMFEALRPLARAAPDARFFFTDDEPELIAFARQTELAPRLVVYETRRMRSSDGYRRGVETIVTLLLRARCGIAVRTPSHLAAWAGILNLDQKVVMLRQPSDDFPDARVWRDRREPAELARWMTQNLRFRPAHHC